MPMKRVTVTLETVTPMFMGGINPNGPPELRPASFRGVLRWWLRALVPAKASVEHQVKLDEVRRVETSVFGETDHASPIIVRVRGQPRANHNFILPERSALNYLWYGLYTRTRSRREGNRNVQNVQMRYRPPFQPGEQFKLILQTRPARTDHSAAFEQACRALWAMVTLGGLGARSRRGSGILTVRDVEGDWPAELPDLRLARAGSINELLERLPQGLRQLHGPRLDRKSYPEPLPYANLRPDRYILVVFEKSWPDWESALSQMGQAFRAFRSRRDPDYQTVKNFIRTGRINQSVERAAFGLPLPFYYRSLTGRKATVEGKGFERLASPLHFRLWQLANGQVAAGFILFRSPLLPKGKDHLALRSGPDRGQAKVPSQRIISDFLVATMTESDESYIAKLWEVRA